MILLTFNTLILMLAPRLLNILLFVTKSECSVRSNDFFYIGFLYLHGSKYKILTRL